LSALREALSNIIINKIMEEDKNKLENKIWYRLLKILYFFSYCLVPVIVSIVWDNNAPHEYGSFKHETVWFTHTLGYYMQSTLLIFLTIIISIIVIRLMKVIILYIIIGQRPEWKKEFKKLF